MCVDAPTNCTSFFFYLGMIVIETDLCGSTGKIINWIPEWLCFMNSLCTFVEVIHRWYVFQL